MRIVVDRMVDEAIRQVGPLTTIVTGGESGIFESLMASPVIRDPLLVLRGFPCSVRSSVGGTQ